MGEIVRGINKLSYSLQCALFGLYEGTSADMSMFGDGAVQKMLDLAENGNAEESKHMLENVCQLVEKSYPLRVMQQGIFCQIADKLNLLVIQFGGEDRTIESINEIEDLLLSLKDKTREIYLKMASESISKFDEAEVIDSKKENSEKEG